MSDMYIPKRPRSAATAMLVGLVAASLAACAGETPMPDEAEPMGPVPVMLEETPSDPEAIRPFTIEVPDEVLDDLQARLSRARLPDQIPGTAWDYGTERSYLEGLLEYWQHEFDWRAQEATLNQFDNFKRSSTGSTCTSSISGPRMKTRRRCC